MEMEGEEEGSAVKPKSTTPRPPLGNTGSEGESGSSLGSSGSGTPDEGDEGRQVNVPGQEEGDDEGGGGGGSESEARDDGDDADDDDDGWSTVSEDDPMEEGQGRQGGDDDDSEDDISLADDDSDSSEEEDEEDDPVDDEDDGEERTDTSDGEASSSGSPELKAPSDFCGAVAGELHPMRNPVILHNLFDLCPPRLLANFRLVCKQWWNLSLEAWQSSVNLKFDHNYVGKVQLHCVLHDDTRDFVGFPLKDFLTYVDNPKHQCQLKPFRRYALTSGFKFPLEESRSVRTRKLWELVKRNATSLKIHHCSFPNLDVFRKVIYEVSPNLRQLELYDCHIGHRKEPNSVGVYPVNLNLKSLSIGLEGDMSEFQFPWLELFSQFPALTRLSFGIELSAEEPEDEPLAVSELLRVLEAIKTVRERDPRKLPMKELVIHPEFQICHDDEHFGQIFSLLLELRLPLQSLALRMETRKQKKVHELSPEIDGSRFRSLTFYHEAGGISIWKFPFSTPLENLQKLYMRAIIWESMYFLTLVPNLNKLVITHNYRSTPRESIPMMSSGSKEGIADLKLLKMKALTWEYALNEDDLRHLGNWFPNLRLLHAPLNDKLFPIVCEQWRALELIEVDGAELTDKGVTGLSVGQVVEDLDTMELPPNIRQLQNLKYFKYLKSGKITDVSILNGFVKLPHLRELVLRKTMGLSQKDEGPLQGTHIYFTHKDVDIESKYNGDSGSTQE